MNYTDLMLVKDNNEEFLVSNNKLTGDALSVSSFILGSVIQNQHFQNGDGMIGRVDYGFDDEYRKAKLIIECSTKYGYDIATLRDAINELFYGTYVIKEMRLTFDNQEPVKYESVGTTSGELDLGKPNYVGGKQLKVRNVGEIVQSDDDLNFEIEIELETVGSPYLEKSYTTQDLTTTKYASTVEKYGLVDGINIDYLDYTFTTRNFYLWNASNLVVDPRYMQLKITIEGVTSSGNFTLESWTTGDRFIYKDALNSQTIVLDGAKVMVGTVNKLRSTNLSLIHI